MKIQKLPEHYCPHMDKTLHGCVIEDILDPQLFYATKNYIKSLYDIGDTKTFGKHNTIINFNNNNIKLAQSLHNKREIFLLYDTTAYSDYYYQTKDTVRNYVLNKIAEIAHPAITKTIYYLSNLDIFAEDKTNYVPLRAHANWQPFEQLLTLHFDTDPSWWNTKRIYDARCYSFSIYYNSLSKGGQFFTSTGFTFNPKPNSATFFNGTNLLHGVNQNQDKDKTNRMAFTIRFAHKDDLFLPGSPDKRLYSVENFVN